jgi:cyanate permease
MRPSSVPSLRTLVLVSLASLGWAFGFGLGAPLAALWLEQHGLDRSVTGLNTSLYYLGVALAAPLVPCLMRRCNRACVITGMTLDAATTALFPLCGNLLAWHALRLVGGLGTALSLIPMETLVNHNAPADRRARHFAVYAVCVALGITLGSVLGLALFPFAPRLAFALGGLVTLSATALAWLVMPSRDQHEEAAGSAALPWRAGLFGFGTAWAQGFLEGGTLTFFPSICCRWATPPAPLAASWAGCSPASSSPSCRSPASPIASADSVSWSPAICSCWPA